MFNYKLYTYRGSKWGKLNVLIQWGVIEISFVQTKDASQVCH